MPKQYSCDAFGVYNVVDSSPGEASAARVWFYRDKAQTRGDKDIHTHATGVVKIANWDTICTWVSDKITCSGNRGYVSAHK